jgi:hypothetical protein
MSYTQNMEARLLDKVGELETKLHEAELDLEDSRHSRRALQQQLNTSKGELASLTLQADTMKVRLLQSIVPALTYVFSRIGTHILQFLLTVMDLLCVFPHSPHVQPQWPMANMDLLVQPRPCASRPRGRQEGSEHAS